MSDTTVSTPIPTLDAETHRSLEAMLAEMDRIQLLIREQEVISDRLKTETEFIAAQTDAMLAQNRQILDQLQKGRSK